MGSISGPFTRDERGSVAIIFGFALLLLGVCAGGAIDFARYTSAKSQTSNAIDAAVLAGARTLLLGGSKNDAEAAAMEYYTKNIVNRYQVTHDDVSFTVADNNTAITGTGNAHLKTTLLQLAGINSLPLVSTASAGFPKAQINSGGGGDIEVSIMLDVTGSMCNDGAGPCTTGTKLDALKMAANDLVNIVVRDDQSQFKSRIALVPFAQRIRVAPNGQGAALMKRLTNLDATWSGWRQTCTDWTTTGSGSNESGSFSYGTCNAYASEQVTNWQISPCVTDRFYESSYAMDYTDDAPGNNTWMNGENGHRFPLSQGSASTPFTSGLGQTSSDPATDYWTYSSNGSCNEPEANEIMRLSSDKTALTARINGLTGTGGTNGALGTAFSWYLLSPNWNSVWSADSSGDAGPYSLLTTVQPNGKPKLRKVAILMSDGVYTSYRGWSDKDQQTSSNYAKSMCTAMKAAGIEIYTVGFDLDSLPATEKAIAIDTLQSCGSSIEHFYNSLDPAELQTAFRDIAVKLSSISLTQ